MEYGCWIYQWIDTDVMWILAKLVDYEKSHKWSKWIMWISYVSKWNFGSILSNCVKRNIEKSIRLIHGWIRNIMAKIRWYKGETNVYGLLKGHLTQLVGENKTSMYFGSLSMSFESIIDITKKVTSLVSFIASIVFNNSFGMENHIYWTFEWNMRGGQSIDS